MVPKYGKQWSRRCVFLTSRSHRGIGANQLGIGMSRPASRRSCEQAVIPIGVFNPKVGVTLALTGILGNGVSRILEPAMTEEKL
jgi:hypothetical protein